jgi:acyl-CoA thioesterase
MTGYEAFVYPSICFSMEIKKDPSETKWLFMRIESYEIKNGRFDEVVQIVDEEGDLVAIAKHVGVAQMLNEEIQPVNTSKL